MKILLIGYYDYPWHAKAFEWIDDDVCELNLDYQILKLINTLLYPPIFLTDEQQDSIKSLVEQYDKALICEGTLYKEAF